MKQKLAIAIAIGTWMLMCPAVWGQDNRGRQSRTLEDVDTVSDVPRGTTGEVSSIVPQIPNPFLTTPPQPEYREFRGQFPSQTNSYILYHDSIFETLIGDDDVRLKVEFEPYRDGGNLELGLPVE